MYFRFRGNKQHNIDLWARKKKVFKYKPKISEVVF